MTTMTQRLPRAVRMQNAEADRLMAEERKRRESGEAAPQNPPTPTPPASDTPPPNTDGAPAPVADPTPPAPEETVESLQAKLQEANARADTAQHRFQVLKGKYDAEVPRLSAQVADLTKRIDDLTTNPPKPQPPAAKKYLTEKDAALGEDMVDFASRVAKGEAEGATKPLESKITSLEQQLVTIRHGAFMTAMDSIAIKDWRTVNTSREFVEWLDQNDPMSGRKRYALLQDACAVFDAARAATFFDQFAKETGRTTSKPSDGLPGKAKPAPNAGGSGTPPPAGPTKVWTEGEVTKFYTEASKGKYRTNPKEYARIEAEIARAIKEGRYRR